MSTLLRYDTFVKTAQGPAVPGAQIYALFEPANVPSSNSPVAPSAQIPIFSDPAGLIPLQQPLSTDGFGHADFYLADNTPFTLAVYFNGSLSQVYPRPISSGGLG